MIEADFLEDWRLGPQEAVEGVFRATLRKTKESPMRHRRLSQSLPVSEFCLAMSFGKQGSEDRGGLTGRTQTASYNKTEARFIDHKIRGTLHDIPGPSYRL